MLHDFLTANRKELIRRCRGKASRRTLPPTVLSEHGVPLFLEQLVETLRYEEANPGRKLDETFDLHGMPGAAESARTAALHGKSLLEQGYTVDQVGSSRVDLQACKLEYSIVSPK